MIRVGNAIWIGLRFNELALEVVEARDHRPLAIIEQGRVHRSDAEGIDVGMTAPTAQALIADLLVKERQPALEDQALQGLALWAYQYTPSVVLAANNTLLLEMGSCRRLHGSLLDVLERMRSGLAQRGHCVTMGLAHTPKAAWLLALPHPPLPLRDGNHLDVSTLQCQLAAIPIDTLAVDSKIITRLQHMGIESLGRILALDVAALGKRFGADFIRYVQQLTGHIPDPQRFIELKPEFEHSTVFLDGVPDRQMLLFPMKRLLQSLSDYLIARQLHCRSVQWLFGDFHQIRATMDVELSRPHHHWKPLFDVSQLKLDQVEMPELVFNLTLYADQFVPVGTASQQLFEEDCADEEGHALIDKLAGRLGADALYRLHTAESLWPESANALLPISETAAICSYPAGERPTWLLPEPQLLRERDQQLWWRKPLDILSGPERLCSPPALGHVQYRDYFVARETSGAICRIFRELNSGRWFVHGLFA